MIDPKIIFGRLGNSMFQYAFLYAYALDHGLDFYFQDPYFFEDHANAIRTLFSGEIPDPTDRVGIHVRRGANPLNPNEPKYCENPFYVDLSSTDYYKRAMKMFPKGEKFMVFSDDIEWCKEQPIFKDCKFWHFSELEDMNKMSSCKAQIIANSSFSWWAAWLCPAYPNNKVIAPKQWFTDGVERCILPKHWIRI